MSDNYADVQAEAKKLIERFVDLEVDYQAYYAYNQIKDDYDWTDEEKASQFAAYSDEYRAEIASWFDDLHDRFDELAKLPDPEPLKAAADQFAPALTILAGPSGHTDISAGHEYGPSASFQHLTDMGSKLHDWNGLAAAAFKDVFLPPMERVVHHEFESVVSLRGPLLASAEMWKKARQDVSDLIDAANAALNDYEGARNPGAESFLLTVIGAIVAVAAVPATGGTSVALYWAIAGSAISVTGAAVAYPHEPKKELQLDGDSPAEIAQKLREAIADMDIQWIEDEGFIRDQIYTLSDLMNGYSGPKGSGPIPRGYPYYSTDHTFSQDNVDEFYMPRPALADVKPGNVTGDGGFGHPDV